MLQHIVVALAVLGAAFYTVWSLVPVRLRFTALTRLDAALGPAPGVLRERIVAPLLRRAMASGGCAGCGSGGTPNAPAAKAAAAASGRLRRP